MKYLKVHDPIAFSDQAKRIRAIRAILSLVDSKKTQTCYFLLSAQGIQIDILTFQSNLKKMSPANFKH